MTVGRLSFSGMAVCAISFVACLPIWLFSQDWCAIEDEIFALLVQDGQAIEAKA